LYQLSTDSRNVKIGVTEVALFSIEVGNVINETGNNNKLVVQGSGVTDKDRDWFMSQMGKSFYIRRI
jgi:hypothetical protein